MKYPSSSFAYTVARIRVLETRLLNTSEIERMIGAKNALDAYKVLNELDYAEFLGETKDIEHFQDVIDAGMREAKHILLKICPFPEILDILWFKYDYHNIKVLLKAKKRELDEENIRTALTDMGKYSRTDLIKFISRNKIDFSVLSSLPRFLQKEIIETYKVFKETDNPILLDNIIDKNYFSLAIKLVHRLKNNFLTEYFKKSIDISNIKAFIRIKKLDYKKELLEQTLISAGHISKDIFLKLFSHPLNSIKTELKSTIYGHMVSVGLDALEKNKTFLAIEKEGDNFLLSHINESKYMVSGPEPVFAYFWIKKNNAETLRAIMIGKLSGSDPSSIREKIKPLHI